MDKKEPQNTGECSKRKRGALSASEVVWAQEVTKWKCYVINPRDLGRVFLGFFSSEAEAHKEAKKYVCAWGS
jgi:hypothetical protein